MWEFKYLNKYWSAKTKKLKVITKHMEIEYITSKTGDGNLEF